MTTTPAGELRAASKLMRERARTATPGPWETSGRAVDQLGGDYAEVIGGQVDCMSYCYGEERDGGTWLIVTEAGQ